MPYFDALAWLFLGIFCILSSSHGLTRITNQTWSSISLLATDVTFYWTDQHISLFAATTKCLSNDDCHLICETETGYGFSTDVFEAEYIDFSQGNRYLCYTRETCK